MNKIYTPVLKSNTYQPIYKITYRDRTSVEVGEGSSIYCTNHYDRMVGKNPNLKPLSEIMLFFKDKDGHHNYKVPVEAVKMTKVHTSIFPYCMGVLIGSSTVKARKLYLRSLYPNVKRYLDNNINMKNVVCQMRALGVSDYGKITTIPKVFLNNNMKSRRDLLGGLLDSMGTVNPDKRIIVTTQFKTLAKDIINLVQSIGGIAQSKVYRSQGIVIQINLPYEMGNPYIYNKDKKKRFKPRHLPSKLIIGVNMVRGGFVELT